MPDLLAQLDAACAFLKARIKTMPELGIVLGTGLGPVANSLEIEAAIPYHDIPHFAHSTVEGHEGKLLFGRMNGKTVAMMQGRLHYYEGHLMQDIAFPVRVLKRLGAKSLLITNVAGGINPQFAKGDLMVITDHINLLGTNPLIGKNYEEVGTRFPDMSEPYHRVYIAKLSALALSQGLMLHKGVYACMSGPCLETAAEYRMLRIIGADAIGMSTVPEVIAAVHAGLKVLAISLITDICLPDHLEPIDIPDIMRIAGESEPRMGALIRAMVPML